MDSIRRQQVSVELRYVSVKHDIMATHSFSLLIFCPSSSRCFQNSFKFFSDQRPHSSVVGVMGPPVLLERETREAGTEMFSTDRLQLVRRNDLEETCDVLDLGKSVENL